MLAAFGVKIVTFIVYAQYKFLQKGQNVVS